MFQGYNSRSKLPLVFLLSQTLGQFLAVLKNSCQTQSLFQTRNCTLLQKLRTKTAEHNIKNNYVMNTYFKVRSHMSYVITLFEDIIINKIIINL